MTEEKFDESGANVENRPTEDAPTESRIQHGVNWVVEYVGDGPRVETAMTMAIGYGPSETDMERAERFRRWRVSSKDGCVGGTPDFVAHYERAVEMFAQHGRLLGMAVSAERDSRSILRTPAEREYARFNAGIYRGQMAAIRIEVAHALASHEEAHDCFDGEVEQL
jgi:hypothetical protein